MDGTVEIDHTVHITIACFKHLPTSSGYFRTIAKTNGPRHVHVAWQWLRFAVMTTVVVMFVALAMWPGSPDDAKPSSIPRVRQCERALQQFFGKTCCGCSVEAFARWGDHTKMPQQFHWQQHARPMLANIPSNETLAAWTFNIIGCKLRNWITIMHYHPSLQYVTCFNILHGAMPWGLGTLRRSVASTAPRLSLFVPREHGLENPPRTNFLSWRPGLVR